LSMARDGLLPETFFAEIHPRTRTPWKSCLLLGGLTTILSLIMPGNVLLSMTNIGTLFAFTFVCISLPVYRFLHPERPRPFRAPLSNPKFPLVPVLGAGLSIILAFSLDSQNWYRLLGWIGAGLAIYLLFGRRNARKVRERKASLPSNLQYYQGADSGHHAEIPHHHHGNAHHDDNEYVEGNQGVITDKYSDPPMGVHKDNINDAPYVPEYGHQSYGAQSLTNASAPSNYATGGGLTTSSSQYPTPSASGATTPAYGDDYARHNQRYL